MLWLKHFYMTQSSFFFATRIINKIINLIHFLYNWACSEIPWMGKSISALSPGWNSLDLAFLSYHTFMWFCADFRFFCANSFAFFSLSCTSYTCTRTLLPVSSSNQHSIKSFKGPWGRCQILVQRGWNSWIDSLAANSKSEISSSQSFPSLVQ